MSSFPNKQKKTFSIAFTIALVLAVGLSDYFSGVEMEFGLFYLIPVLLAVTINRQFGFIICFASALVSFFVDVVLGRSPSNLFYNIWNFISHIAIFSLVVLLRANLLQAKQNEHELARTDSLTGALNPRAFHELAETEISRSSRYKHPFTIAYIDVDNFKTVNDIHGHNTGDKLLCAIVKGIKNRVRRTDMVAKLGGDEFAILLPETPQDVAQTIIGQIKNHLTDDLHRDRWPVTLSIGVLTCIDTPPTVEKMIKAVDTLMYTVKYNGKNSIRYSIYENQK